MVEENTNELSVGFAGNATTKESEIPAKLSKWDEFHKFFPIDEINKLLVMSEIFPIEQVVGGCLWGIHKNLIALSTLEPSSSYSTFVRCCLTYLTEITTHCFILWHRKVKGGSGIISTSEFYQAWGLFFDNVKAITLQGTDKYAGSEKDAKENIDLQPLMFGAHSFSSFVIGDMSKRVFRQKNQMRDRDIFKIALWCYLFYYKLVPTKTDS